MKVDIGGGVRLYFDVEGPGLAAEDDVSVKRPTLVLLHGGPGGDHNYFKPMFSRMADVAQVVYLDQRGHGRSDRSSPDHWNLETWGDDVARFCDALSIRNPIVLGTSFGSVVALSYATRHPGHAGAIVLDAAEARFNLEPVLKAFERLGGPAARQSAERFWTADTFDPESDYMTVCMPLYTRRLDANAYTALMARTIWNVDMLTHYIGPVVRAVDFRADLHKVTCPTMILTGSDDPVMPVEGAEEVAAGIDPALVRLERLENCGHGVFAEDPDRAFALLRGFVDETQKAVAHG